MDSRGDPKIRRDPSVFEARPCRLTGTGTFGPWWGGGRKGTRSGLLARSVGSHVLGSAGGGCRRPVGLGCDASLQLGHPALESGNGSSQISVTRNCYRCYRRVTRNRLRNRCNRVCYRRNSYRCYSRAAAMPAADQGQIGAAVRAQIHLEAQERSPPQSCGARALRSAAGPLRS